MVKDGTFSFVYATPIGMGCGFFVLDDGRLRGRDYAQCEYIGSVIERDDGVLLLKLTATYPPGVFPVSGGAEQELPYSRQLQVTLPRDFDEGRPIAIDAPGEMTIMVRRLPEGYTVETFARDAALSGFHMALNSGDSRLWPAPPVDPAAGDVGRSAGV